MTVTAYQDVDQPPSTQESESNIIPISSLKTGEILMQAFTAELTLHHRDILIYARAVVFNTDSARDLVQEAALVAWKQFPKFNPAQADFGTWFRGILRNKIRDWAKSRKGGNRPEVTLDDSHLDYLEDSFSQRTETGSFDRLQDCLQKLPRELHRAIQLTYYDGNSGEEASSILKIAHATLRKRLSRARQALHTCLSKNA